MTIIAISRSVQFSPNHIGNDAAIYNKVIEELRSMGHSVSVFSISSPERPLWAITFAFFLSKEIVS